MFRAVEVWESVVLASFIEGAVRLVAPTMEFACQEGGCATCFGHNRMTSVSADVMERFYITVGAFD